MLLKPKLRRIGSIRGTLYPSIYKKCDITRLKRKSNPLNVPKNTSIAVKKFIKQTNKKEQQRKFEKRINSD